jgi:hypothetical protein
MTTLVQLVLLATFVGVLVPSVRYVRELVLEVLDGEA